MRRAFCLRACALVMWLLTAMPVTAQDNEFHELRARMERVERQNQYLLKQLEQQQRTKTDSLIPDGEDEDGELGTSRISFQAALGGTAAAKSEVEPDWHEVGKDLNLTATWRNGLWFESKDKAFKIHIGGRTQFDGAWVNADDDLQFGAGGIGRADDAVNFRRARIAIEGVAWEVMEFNFEFDWINTFDAQRTGSTTPLAANTPVPTDLWVGFTHLPYIGNFRVGNLKPPISFEHMTSSRFLNFMERSLAFDSFIESGDNGFRPGMMALNNWLGDRASWQFGLFKNNAGIFGWNVGDGEYDATGRLTWLPYASDDNRCLLHVGLGASHRDLDDGLVRFRSRSSIRNGPATLHNILAEARLSGDGQSLVVPEVVMNWGPWTMQAEYQASWTYGARETFPVPSADSLGTVFFQGYYVEALYFLTGEHRAYDRKQGRFDRVVPHENFFWVRGDDGNLLGRGAWQLAARFSNIELKDAGIDGSIVNDVTLGLNWFVNPNMKVQWNYSRAYRDAAGASSDGIIQEGGVRFAVDF
jgi:phosphate-selective porin OprO/OprP